MSRGRRALQAEQDARGTYALMAAVLGVSAEEATEILIEVEAHKRVWGWPGSVTEEARELLRMRHVEKIPRPPTELLDAAAAFLQTDGRAVRLSKVERFVQQIEVTDVTDVAAQQSALLAGGDVDERLQALRSELDATGQELVRFGQREYRLLMAGAQVVAAVGLVAVAMWPALRVIAAATAVAIVAVLVGMAQYTRGLGDGERIARAVFGGGREDNSVASGCRSASDGAGRGV